MSTARAIAGPPVAASPISTAGSPAGSPAESPAGSPATPSAPSASRALLGIRLP